MFECIGQFLILLLLFRNAGIRTHDSRAQAVSSQNSNRKIPLLEQTCEFYFTFKRAKKSHQRNQNICDRSNETWKFSMEFGCYVIFSKLGIKTFLFQRTFLFCKNILQQVSDQNRFFHRISLLLIFSSPNST